MVAFTPKIYIKKCTTDLRKKILTWPTTPFVLTVLLRHRAQAAGSKPIKMSTESPQRGVELGDSPYSCNAGGTGYQIVTSD